MKLSDCNFASKLEKKSTEAYEPITFEEIVTVMINFNIMLLIGVLINWFQVVFSVPFLFFLFFFCSLSIPVFHFSNDVFV